MWRATAALGVVLVISAVALASMPFRDSELRCGSPLSGGDASLSDVPANGRDVLVVSDGCTDEAVGRLVLAGVLFPVGIIMTTLGLWFSVAKERPTSR
jgi:uncharacterized metal-binding protein